MAVCVAVIGKDNNPLYIRCAKPEQVGTSPLYARLDCVLAGVEPPLHGPHQPGRGGGEAGRDHSKDCGVNIGQGALPRVSLHIRTSESLRLRNQHQD